MSVESNSSYLKRTITRNLTVEEENIVLKQIIMWMHNRTLSIGGHSIAQELVGMSFAEMEEIREHSDWVEKRDEIIKKWRT